MQRAVWGHRAGTASSAGEEQVVRPGEERAEEQFEDNAPPPTYDPDRAQAAADEIMEEKKLDFQDPVPPQPSASWDKAAWLQQDMAQMAHAWEVAQRIPPPDVPAIEHAPDTLEPYQSPSPWYERWKLPGWFKKWLSARKALGNTSIQVRPWRNSSNRYALSFDNPNWAQRGLRWLKEKWSQWWSTEPPAFLDKLDEALETGGPYVEEAQGILEGFELKPGGGYAPETIKGQVSGSVLKGALKPKTLGLSALVSVAQNVITYGFGSKRHLGIWSPEFVTSTVVDFGVNTALGLAAAGLVAGVVLALPVEWSVAAVGFLGLGAGFAISWVWNLAGGSEWAEGIKQRWAQEIRQAGQDAASDTDDLLEDWPDTPDGLAP